jgi:hypothetical protein
VPFQQQLRFVVGSEQVGQRHRQHRVGRGADQQLAAGEGGERGGTAWEEEGEDTKIAEVPISRFGDSEPLPTVSLEPLLPVCRRLRGCPQEAIYWA